MSRVPSHPRPERLRPSRRAVVAFGANLGDRAATIQRASARLDAAPGIEVEALSALVESAAVRLDGVDEDAPAYLNAIALVRTALAPDALLDELQRIENENGRVRTVRWGDRTLDLDLVDYDGLRRESERLTLPHPRAADRAFVLVPWADVDPDAELAGHGRVAELASRVAAEVRPYTAPEGRLDEGGQGGSGPAS